MMNILVVDPDWRERQRLSVLLCQLYDEAEVNSFNDPLMAVKYGANNHVDALYTVSSMKRLSGFELAKMLRELHPQIGLHFIADDDGGKRDAMRIMADSYITRPVTAEALRLAEAAEW